jgi:hypothetical protein
MGESNLGFYPVMPSYERFPAAWAAGLVVFVLAATIVTVNSNALSFPIGGGMSFTPAAPIVLVCALLAAYCGYRLGRASGRVQSNT